jgi:hypothetical protein
MYGLWNIRQILTVLCTEAPADRRLSLKECHGLPLATITPARRECRQHRRYQQTNHGFSSSCRNGVFVSGPDIQHFLCAILRMNRQSAPGTSESLRFRWPSDLRGSKDPAGNLVRAATWSKRPLDSQRLPLRGKGGFWGRYLGGIRLYGCVHVFLILLWMHHGHKSNSYAYFHADTHTFLHTSPYSHF